MKSLSGSIFPPPPPATTTASIQENIDYDDEDEDSPASTIVPPSPLGSRRNSFINHGGATEEDTTTSTGDNLSSSIEYDIIAHTNGLYPQSQSAKSNTGPLPSSPETPRNPRSTAPGLTSMHEQRGSHQRNATHHATIQQTTRGEQQQQQPRPYEPVANKQSRTYKNPSHPPQTPRMEGRAPPPTQTEASPATPTVSASKLHPRVAVILGVDRKWYLPLVVCRALSVGPALWWGLRCAFTFLAELLRIRPGSMWREGWVAIVVSSAAADWDVERRFRVTEVALAIMWCCASAYLSYFFMDCMMSRWLLNYSPPAVLIRLLATNGLIAYLTSSVLWLSGASSDPRLLLPAWISITTTLTFLYHATQNHAMIKRETTASISVLSVASYISMSLILLQLHLTRDNEPEFLRL
uniref:N-glycosylation protein EOS1 n=1 Tax=Talaromyces marneffei PM1 TaxID=1077442 RepID=A0A093XW26_TALMA